MEDTAAKTPGWTPRLDFVASRSHFYPKEGAEWQSGPRVLEKINRPDALTFGPEKYGTSKLLEIHGVREIAKLATKEDGTPSVIVNYTCPGACRSNLGQGGSSLATKIALWLIHRTVCKTTEEGSRTLVYATCLGDESHGKWVHNRWIEEPAPLVTNETGRKLQKKVWEETLELLRNHGYNP